LISSKDTPLTSVIAYTDGACSGNPGPGGWGVVLISGSHRKEISGGEAETTNNRMELTAAIKALEALKKTSRIEILTDSTYVVKGMTEWISGWKRRGWRRASGELENRDLWQKLHDLSQTHEVTWKWVRGHAGNELNEVADKLAVKGIPKKE
jgi:ribonuclease HI